MAKEIVLDHLPAGYAKHGGRPNEEIDVGVFDIITIAVNQRT